MCSIVGGNSLDEKAFSLIQEARDRGRNFTGLAQNEKGWWICNHRATPTTEKQNPNQNQPFGKDFKVVHNGTIQNDKDLGCVEGDLDSFALTKVLDLKGDLLSFKDSLRKIKGSYALAAMKEDDIFLACNYKPIWICIEPDGKIYFSSLEHHFLKDVFTNRPIRMTPYSVLDLKNGYTSEIYRTQHDRAIIICSGGLDSTAVAAYAREQHKEILLLHFAYGCRAQNAEINAIKNIAKYLDCDYKIVSLPYTDLTGGSPLLDNSKEISKGEKGAEYAFEWVPARNFLFLAYTTAYAEANNYGHIYLGTNLEEGGAYPDNEEQFILDVNKCLYGAVQNGVKIEIHSPLGGLMKHEIVQFGEKYGAPFKYSWSCYHDGDKHCGECGPCYMRKVAFQRAVVDDPTVYVK